MGDQIVRVNGFTIAEAIHEEVLNLIKGRDEIELKVASMSYSSLVNINLIKHSCDTIFILV